MQHQLPFSVRALAAVYRLDGKRTHQQQQSMACADFFFLESSKQRQLRMGLLVPAASDELLQEGAAARVAIFHVFISEKDDV